MRWANSIDSPAKLGFFNTLERLWHPQQRAYGWAEQGSDKWAMKVTEPSDL